MRERVLLVEDDAAVREAAALLLERAGVQVTAVSDGRDALDVLAQGRFDLVVLDIMLPSLDGFEVCRSIRKTSQIPIIMLTARVDTTDVVTGLELGADDYVTKPFEGPELVARIRAVTRRRSSSDDGGVIRVGLLEIDEGAFRVTQGDEPVELTATEFRLLVELARSPGRVLTREVLLERVWGYDYLGDSRLVDMAVKRLRDKLGDDPRDPRYIATIRGVGYRFDAA
jgi:two-component system response regulator MtrA